MTSSDPLQRTKSVANPASRIRCKWLQDLQEFPPGHRWAPSLLAEGEPVCCDYRSKEFEPVPALALSAVEDDSFTGEWSLNREAQQSLLDAIGNQVSVDELLRSRSTAGMQTTSTGATLQEPSKGERSSSSMATAASTKVKDTCKKLYKNFHMKDDAKSKSQVIEYVELAEIERWVAVRENQDFVLEGPNSLHGILYPSSVEEAFAYFDKDDSGTLDTQEWSNFLDKLAFLHTKYLLRSAFLDFRAFFARGQPWSLDSQMYSMKSLRQSLCNLVARSTPEDDARRTYEMLQKTGDEEMPFNVFQIGYDIDCPGRWPIPVGWLEDLIYYSANNHPLHGIFCCDPFHPLNWIERLSMELATFGLAFLTIAMHDWYVEDNEGVAVKTVPQLHNGLVFSLCVVTLPGIIIWWALFLLFTCKCGMVNEAVATAAEVRKGWWTTCAGETCGHIIVTSLVAYLIYAVGPLGPDFHNYVKPVLLGRAKGYIIAWIMMTFVYFNPLIAWGNPDPCTALAWGDYIGLGQWRIEKQRFQVMCLRGIKDIQLKSGDMTQMNGVKDGSNNAEKPSMYKRAKKRMMSLWRRKHQPAE